MRFRWGVIVGVTAGLFFCFWVTIINQTQNTSFARPTFKTRPPAVPATGALGSIRVPSLGINQPIILARANALNQGVEMLQPQVKGTDVDPAFAHGNLILAGHNYNNGLQRFSALQQTANQDAPYLINGQPQQVDWLNGTQVLIVNAERVRVYTIDYQRAVKASDTSVLQQTDNDQLTLITCLYPSDQYRIITHATQTGNYPADAVPSDIGAELN